MSNGWVKLYRKIQQHWLWDCDKPFDKRSAWIDILLMVNHKKKKINLGNELVEVGRGEKITSERKLADRWGWSRTKVRNFLELLESDSMIEAEKTTKKTTLKVLNYGDYQHIENQKKTRETPQENQEKAERKPQKNTNKNVKNVKNEKNNNSEDKFSIEKMENGRYNYPDGYEEVYSAYPDNNGTKKAGWRKWAARRREGISNEKLLAAALNYAKECQREDRDKKYVKHIATFFGPDEHWKQYFSLKEVDDSERSSGDDQESNGEGSKDEGSRLQEKAFELMGLS